MNTKEPTENSVLFKQAKESLKGKWSISIRATITIIAVALIIPNLISEIVRMSLASTGDPQLTKSITNLTSNIATILISGAIAIGLATFSLSVARKEESKFSLVFMGFEKLWQGVGAYFLMNLLIFLRALLLLLPLIVFLILDPSFITSDIIYSPLKLMFLIIIMLIFSIPAMIASISYSMTYYVIADDEDMGALDAITTSKEIMDGNKWKFSMLSFRFFGLALLAVLTLGIGFFWLLPYMNIVIAKFYDDIKPQDEKVENSSADFDFGAGAKQESSISLDKE